MPEVITCPACGEQNPPRARFCLACATPLAVPAVRAATEERKVVSVLFCDLVGFTARSDNADPEDVRAALRPYHATLRAEIERFGGTVEKFIGDAVMAVFGAPVAHEDDPERAVRAGLRILDAISELNQARQGLELAVRIGIATGEAVVALQARPELGEGIVTGDVVNTAARLQTAAPVGGVIVGTGTWRATRESVDYAELPPVTAKGKAAPVPVWQAVRIRPRVYADLAHPATPFFGREEELTTLKAAYGRAARESSVQIVTITGEPGIGKSRLLAEFSAYLDGRPELVAWRQGRCLPYGEGITFGPLAQIVKTQAGIEEADDRDAVRQKLVTTVDRVVADDAERDWFVNSLAVLVGLGEQDGPSASQREEFFSAWRRFLEAVAAQTLLVLVLEDLHWADPVLLEFVEHLLEWSESVPVLVLGTARPELFERAPGWGGGRRNSITIALSPLSDVDTARLLSALLQSAVLPAETQSSLLERAGGNPLFAEELARALRDQELLTRLGGRPAAIADIPFPDTVQALIAARLDTLPAELKTLLGDAAVLGRVFWSGALAEMGACEEGDVRRGLRELARREFIRPVRSSSISGQVEYSFWHALTRDVAYHRLPRIERAIRHRAAAAWLERLAGEREAEHADVLAHHYDQAIQLASSAGRDDMVGELTGRAIRFLTLAGDRASGLNAVAAAAHYRRALELTTHDDVVRADLLRKAAGAAAVIGEVAAAQELAANALAVYRSLGDAVGAARALTALSAFESNLTGDTARAHELLLEAVHVLNGQPPVVELADAYGELAINSMILGRPDEGVRYGEDAVRLCEQLHDERQLVYALGCRGIARLASGQVGGVADLESALDGATRLGITPAVLSSHANLGEARWVVESAQRGLNTYAAGIDFARQRGIVAWEAWISVMSLRPLFDLGRWDEATREAERLAEASVPLTGYYFWLPRVVRAQVLLLRGHVGRAAALVDDVLDDAAADPQTLLPPLTVAAIAAAEQGNRGRVDKCLDAIVGLSGPGSEWFRALELPDLARVCVHANRPDALDRLMSGVDDQAARHRCGLLSARANRAEHGTDYESAVRLYTDAAAEWESHGSLIERAHALLGAARCLARLDDPEADRVAETAAELFTRLRARPVLEPTVRPGMSEGIAGA